MTIRAKCEAVADMLNSHHAKIGEEVRFYVDGVCVDTRRLHKPEDYGTFKVGEEYEIEAELPKSEPSLPAPAPPDSIPSSETGPSLERWGGREGDDLKPNDFTGNASSSSSSPTGMVVPPTDA